MESHPPTIGRSYPLEQLTYQMHTAGVLCNRRTREPLLLQLGIRHMHVWEYMQLHGLAFGLSSAVVSFNRRPTLLVATSRIMLCIIAAAYFDDLPIVDMAAGHDTAITGLIQLLGLVG